MRGVAFVLLQGCVATTTAPPTGVPPVHTGGDPDPIPVLHSGATTGCEGERVFGDYRPDTSTPHVSGAGPRCENDRRRGLSNGCDVVLGDASCPTFRGLVDRLDWFTLSPDERGDLYRCVHDDGVDIDVAHWVDTAAERHVTMEFLASSGEVTEIYTAFLPGSGGAFCCQGQQGGSAEWDPNGEELDGWRWDCEEIVDYGPEDFD